MGDMNEAGDAPFRGEVELDSKVGPFAPSFPHMASPWPSWSTQQLMGLVSACCSAIPIFFEGTEADVSLLHTGSALHLAH